MNMRPENFVDVGSVNDVPLRGSRVVHTPSGDVAIFKAADGAIFALRDRCPHKHGPLSQGIVHGRSVSCPLHNWNIDLQSGEAQGADQGCTKAFSIRIASERILLDISAFAPAEV